MTDQPDRDIAVLERRQRQRAGAEDEIRADKDTGLRNLPFRDFDMNVRLARARLDRSRSPPLD